MSKIIRKSDKERERGLIDDFLNQLQADNLQPVEEAPPIQITDQVKERMIKLMESFLVNKDKLVKLNAIKKGIETQSRSNLTDLTTLMKLYGLSELIKGGHKFVLEQTTKKKPLKKDEFKEVMTIVLADEAQVAKIYNAVDEVAEEVTVEKLKCLKYKGQ